MSEIRFDDLVAITTGAGGTEDSRTSGRRSD